MRVSDINWSSWEPEEVATLMFVQQGDEVLLIRKKRGLGAGKINGPGGKIEGDETPMACAIRETEEELLITPTGVQHRGELFFHSNDFPRIHAYVYTATGFSGTPRETIEAAPLWFHIDDIPYHEMWADDEHWLPQVLQGQTIRGRFTFIGESLLDHHVIIDP